MAELKRYDMRDGVFDNEQIKRFSETGRHVSAVKAVALVDKQRGLLMEATGMIKEYRVTATIRGWDKTEEACIALIKRLEEGVGDE